MASDLSDIKAQLGRLSGSVEAMVARLDRAERMHETFVTETNASRQRLHERVERQREDMEENLREQRETLHAIQMTTQETTRNLAALTAIVKDDVKPQTDDLKRWKLMGVGFLTMVGIAGAGIGVVLANWGQSILAFFLRR